MIARDAGLLSLEYIFHYVAMVLQLLRWLYLIVGDSHFGYFACFQNARSIINRLCFRFAFKNQAERQSFFPIDLLTHSNTPLQEPKNCDNCYTLTFILLARLGKSWKTFSGKLVWTIDSIFFLQLRTEIFYIIGRLNKTHLLRVTLLHSPKSFQESRQVVCQKSSYQLFVVACLCRSPGLFINLFRRVWISFGVVWFQQTYIVFLL